MSGKDFLFLCFFLALFVYIIVRIKFLYEEEKIKREYERKEIDKRLKDLEEREHHDL